MAATKDINTDIGKVRYLIGDTDLTAPNFQDDELQGFLTLAENIQSCLCLRARVLSCDHSD
jgi:hypothetical protein